jgi:hypothetical protein
MAASLACAASSLSFILDGLDGDARGFEDAFGVAHGVEGRGARADGADAEILQALYDAADLRKPFEIGLEFGRGQGLSVQRGERVENAVLHHIVATAHLSAKAVAAVGDGHGIGAIGRGLHQHGHFQSRQADGVDDAALLAEVGQRDDDAVDLFGVFLEERGAALGLSVSFHRAVMRLVRAEHDGHRSGGLKDCDDFFAAGFGQVMREKSAIAYDDSECHFALRCHVRAPLDRRLSSRLVAPVSRPAVLAASTPPDGLVLRFACADLEIRTTAGQETGATFLPTCARFGGET